ncbi:hypothetical protein ACFC1T_21860 [Kitasatospora sp. NPDC056076]|uniref:hypothetical protein n=1 Tax=Kitasatospora sp. NPDC056076 TaxID=3345703 RepID=UPI0035D5E243
MAADQVPADARLVEAVRARDEDAVWAALGAGADPDVRGGDGLPVLCAAVAGFDHAVANALVTMGADPDLPLPDGTTPLLRAVDLGSYAVLGAVLGEDPALRLGPAERERLLGLARSWYATGARAELRRRTGAEGPGESLLIEEEFCQVEQVSLGGFTVRAGHGAVLTTLEWTFRIATPVDELVARAVRQPDDRHVDGAACQYVLAQRPDRATWEAVMAYRRHPDPRHRRFTASFLTTNRMVPPALVPSFEEEKEDELLAVWAAEETDGEVLAEVLQALLMRDHPGTEGLALRHADHPDREVRTVATHCLGAGGQPFSAEVTACLLRLARDEWPPVRAGVARRLENRPLTEEFRAVLLALAGDEDARVRLSAGCALAESDASDDRTGEVADALAALSDEEDQRARVVGAYGLVVRGDRRAAEAVDRVGALPWHEYRYDHRAEAIWAWRTGGNAEGT